MWHFLAQEPSQSSWADFIDGLARTPLSRVVFFVAICSVLRVAIWPYLTKTPAHKRFGAYSGARILNETLDAIVYAGVFVFLVIRPFGIQAFKIPSGSMLDTLQINDFIVANKAIYRYTEPQVGDIVVFRPPTYACMPNQIDSDGQVNVDFIKRLRGLPGDLVEIKNGVLYRNGVPQNEPFLKNRPDRDFKLVKYKGQDFPLTIDGDNVNIRDGRTAQPYILEDPHEMAIVKALPPERIPPGHYLMMGDNRQGSFDGRAWGLIERDQIVGRSEFIWLPIGRWQRTIRQ